MQTFFRKAANTTTSFLVHGGYTEWSSWSEYVDNSTMCQGVFKFKTRDCINPVPGPNGDNCTVIGPPVAVETPASKPCPGIIYI